MTFRLSISEEARRFGRKANRLIVRVPAEQLRRIADTPGVSSIRSETQHFVGCRFQPPRRAPPGPLTAPPFRHLLAARAHPHLPLARAGAPVLGAGHGLLPGLLPGPNLQAAHAGLAAAAGLADLVPAARGGPAVPRADRVQLQLRHAAVRQRSVPLSSAPRAPQPSPRSSTPPRS